ncbi:MAG: hypothetical protein ABSC88_10380 [Terracidiphilus sp.]|jgi:hypothetical protein
MAEICYCGPSLNPHWPKSITSQDWSIESFDIPQEQVDDWVYVWDHEWFPEDTATEANIIPLVTAQLLETQFTRLVATWREETENVSSLTQVVSNPAYQRVIDLGKHGENVVPLILKDFAKNHGYWGNALRSITGENPVLDKHIGNPTKVREDWLRWGKQRGYI